MWCVCVYIFCLFSVCVCELGRGWVAGSDITLSEGVKGILREQFG
uniref:Uncharacterized protein n=1 Tax=Anguilla anguilla TaxID=7936 RepID=A0A0E9W252_ANGAN